jgi:diguanylate cyclase (GGDEF)-like protein
MDGLVEVHRVLLFPRNSLRAKLTGILLLTAAISICITIAGFVISDWFILRAKALGDLQTRATILAENSAAALVLDNRAAARATLASQKGDPAIVAAALFGLDGALVADYRASEIMLPVAPPPNFRGRLAGNNYVLVPVKVDNRQVGSVLLVSQFRFWSDRYTALLATALGMFAVTLLIIAIFARRLHRMVADPILNLTNTARKVTQSEDYSLRADKLSTDEIGWLVDDFNEMLNQIQFRDHILQRNREKLEEKVAERTRELTELTHQLEHQAYHDSLTGLANRVTFDDHLKLAIHQADRYGGRVAVMFLDLDRFKIINDTLGHVVGDKLLVNVARRLRQLIRENDTLARLGGDEFGVLIMHPGNEAIKADDVARKLIDAINEPFHIDGYNLHVTASLGISVYPVDGDSADVILQNADAAMYRSKDQGKNRFSFFSPDMNARAMYRLQVETRLRRAVLQEELEIHYQPRRDAQSLDLLGVEALVRWHDRELGNIPPSEFIPIAQDCGLCALIDDWVLKTACQEVLSWFGGDRPPIALSVNFSASQFIRKDLQSVVSNILKQTGYPGDMLELEITEDLFGPDTSNVMDVLRELRKLNIEISIDDFGKAYSSLSRLKQLPLHTLKIDQSFVEDIPENPDDCVLVRTVITMAKSLGLKVIAEGIENHEQHEFVKRYGCDAVQGFLFGKPQTGAALKALVNQELALNSLQSGQQLAERSQ